MKTFLALYLPVGLILIGAGYIGYLEFTAIVPAGKTLAQVKLDVAIKNWPIIAGLVLVYLYMKFFSDKILK